MARAARREGAAVTEANEKAGTAPAKEEQRVEAQSNFDQESKKEPDFAQIAKDSGRGEGEVRAQYEMNQVVQHAQGTPPKAGREGGVIEDGTGDFDPDKGSVTIQDRESRRATAPPEQALKQEVQAPEGFMVVVDSNGEQTLDEIGVDGVNPVSTQNPHPKAVRK